MSTETEKTSKIIAEYAKSNRATCKAKTKCKIDPMTYKIPQGSLKIGITYGSTTNFEVVAFKHYECQPATWFAKNLKAAEEICGFSDLSAQDQEMLKRRFDNLDQEVKELEQELEKEKEHKRLEKEAEKERKKTQKAAEAAKKKKEKMAAKQALKKNTVGKKKKAEVSSEAVVPAI